MEQKTYIVEGRQFRTEADYNRAVRDREVIEKLRSQTDFRSRKELGQLCRELEEKKYHFFTLLGEDFLDEVRERLKELEKGGSPSGKKKKSGKERKAAENKKGGRKQKASRALEAGKDERQGGKAEFGSGVDPLDPIVVEELKKRERNRRLAVILCSMVAVCCLGYFALYIGFKL